MATRLVATARLFQLRRHLRQLQRAYYGASRKDETVIVEYLQTLAAARQLAVSGSTAYRVHLGCGDHRIDGWFNVDIVRSPQVDLQANLSRPFPFRDDSVDLIHSEDLIEHLELQAGRHLLAECFRVLRPGGVMRLLTPDLRLLVRRVYLHPRADHLAWCQAQLRVGTPCEALNMHCRMGGEHRFIYDFPYLRDTLVSLGFRVRRVSWNRSHCPGLRYLDLRDFGLNLFLEAKKPLAAKQNRRYQEVQGGPGTLR